jgi:hypothetical protein
MQPVPLFDIQGKFGLNRAGLFTLDTENLSSLCGDTGMNEKPHNAASALVRHTRASFV